MADAKQCLVAKQKDIKIRPKNEMVTSGIGYSQQTRIDSTKT